MPASLALTTPCGANRSTSPGETLDEVGSAWIPLPCSALEKVTISCPVVGLTVIVGGGADIEVLAPRPASMLPWSDQIRILPPPSVKMREAFTFTSPCV